MGAGIEELTLQLACPEPRRLLTSYCMSMMMSSSTQSAQMMMTGAEACGQYSGPDAAWLWRRYEGHAES
jgi:hypothetical protein